jgi:hypothetical protein
MNQSALYWLFKKKMALFIGSMFQIFWEQTFTENSDHTLVSRMSSPSSAEGL